MSKGKGGLAGALGGMFGGNMPNIDPSQMDPQMLAEMEKQMGGQMPDLGGLGSPSPAKELPTSVDDLLKGGAAPRFPGLPGLGPKLGGKK